MALAMMRRAVSPMPMGWTPGFLLRAIKRLAINGAMLVGSTRSVHIRFATKVSDWHRSWEADLNEVHSLCHPSASRPVGPAAPLVCIAADLIMAAFSDSNKTK